MKMHNKGVIALVAIFVAAGVSPFAYACDGTRGNSEQKTMNAYGRGCFKKWSEQDSSGRGNGGGKHHGRHGRRHQDQRDGEHQGKHHRGNKHEGSSNQEQPSGSNSNQNIDFSSYTDSASLNTAAWEALSEKDYGTAQAFAQEAITRYGSQAKEQQASLSGFAPEGSESQYWALNDVATAHFISGSAYKAQGNNTDAAKQFNTIISEYGYAQAYDPEQDIYWKVAEAAQKELENLPASNTQQSSDQPSGNQQSAKQSSGKQQSGESAGDQQTPQQPAGTNQNMDFSQYTDSQSLLTQAWAGYNEQDWATAQAFSQETITRYDQQALEQQASLKNFAPQGQESQYWALNDVATALFISASAYKAQGDYAKAEELLNLIITKYGFAQAYDPAQDIYWKVAEAAQKELDTLQ